MPRTTFRSLSLAAAALAVLIGTTSTAIAQPARPVSPPAPAWEQWVHLVGAVDVGGPRSDGRLVAMAAGRPYLVSPNGTVSPFADGPNGFVGSPDVEPYFVVVPGGAGQPGQCSFAVDDVFILDLSGPMGIVRVDATGRASRFAALPDADWLFGIALDTVGRFGHRLLVSGSRGDRTVIYAIDCRGSVATVTEAAPTIEGGYAVAPESFGPFAGHLIAPDELSGQIWAIAPDGVARVVNVPDLPTGGDTGVESLGFVPDGMGAGGAAYLADRGTPDNPFPGTDSVLRLSWEILASAGVHPGDLLVSTEGGGATVAVRCDPTCTWFPVADGPPGGHIEGHIVFSVR